MNGTTVGQYTDGHPSPEPGALARLRDDLARALASCATEADIAQVLYSMLQPHFGYDGVTVQVLEREGWLHSVAVDCGVLQDMVRGQVAGSAFAAHYQRLRSAVVHPSQDQRVVPSRGPGTVTVPQTAIWVPVLHQEQAIGAVIYQLYVCRDVPAEEISLLEDVHASLGVILNNAYLNALTRNQAVSLTALNAVARALSSTHDEDGVAAALHSTLSTLIPLDRLELAVPEGRQPSRVRIIRVERGQGGVPPVHTRSAAASRRLPGAGAVLRTGRPRLRRRGAGEGEHQSSVWVPVTEGDRLSAVLSLHSRQADAYEQSTVTFLQQVADEVALALRNAWSYSAVEAQRQRLAVVNAVGRRLTSSLDRWSIIRTLREELARHLQFDLLTLATVTETAAGPVARGYAYDSGRERPLPAVPLSAAGPSRQAYESGRPVLFRRSPWAQALESRRRREETRVVGDGAVLDVTRPGGGRRVAARSIVWVPVRQGEQIRALLSLQSYRADAFDEWHVQLLEDVAAHVSMALATAEHFEAAQTERRRLEALHMLEMGVAQAADEREIAEAVFRAACSFLDASRLVLVSLDPQGRLTGHRWEPGRSVEALSAGSVSRAPCFQRLVEVGHTIVEDVAEVGGGGGEVGQDPGPRGADPAWPRAAGRRPSHVVWVPLKQATSPRLPAAGGARVIGGLCAQRDRDQAFTASEIQLLESAAPVVGIALRTLRLHRANQLALAHSVRIQEVAALAGHDLDSVVASIAEQARSMLGAAGAACWAFDDEGRIGAEAATGDRAAAQVLAWSRQCPGGGGGARMPRNVRVGVQGTQGWTLVPLWYADRLVGALGSVQASTAPPLAAAPPDFSRHAAIAIENARLAAETRGRIHTLEAVAAFADLDITRPDLARAEMCRLVERALAGSGGALWLREGDQMVRGAGGAAVERIPVEVALGVTALSSAWGVALPIAVEGDVAGMLTVDAEAASSRETLRLTGVLAGQAALVLGRLRLVAALDRQAEMMNAILTHSPVGVVLEDAEGRIVYANPVIEGMYGFPASGLVGTRAEELPSRAGGTVVSDPDAGPTAPLELRLPERGTVVRVRRVPIPGSQDRGAGVLTLHEDVTEQRALLEAKDLMLRAIGHEVRSPAAAMRATIAGLMQWGSTIDGDQRHALLEEAYQQSDRLLNLVESQLIIAKLETGRFEPNPVPVPLSSALTQTMGVLRSRYGARVAAVELRVGDDLPDACCDPAHLDQVMTNLIGNALEYTSATRIVVSADRNDGWVEVTVEDNGGGLAPDRVGRLFQKTAPAGRGRSRGGLGMGLYLCRLVVERSFRGRIWLARTGPAGTAFTFTVPAARRSCVGVPRRLRVAP